MTATTAGWVELDPGCAEVSEHHADVMDWLASLGVRPRVFRDPQGVLRFRDNPVAWTCLRGMLVGQGQFAGGPLDAIARLYAHDPAARAARVEFYTLLGYSLTGFAEVFSDELAEFNRGRA
jgi:hypothetical protein